MMTGSGGNSSSSDNSGMVEREPTNLLFGLREGLLLLLVL